jgi:hypothetical protein
LRPGEDDRIKAQIEEAEATIERELEEFERQKQSTREEVSEMQEQISSPKEPMGENDAESSAQAMITDPANDIPAQDHTDIGGESPDHEGEVVVEAEEDTVIY